MIPPEKLTTLLAHLPGKPGVYLMQDATGKVIYVGKSRMLKNRVRSYFSVKPTDSKTWALVQAIHELEFIVTTNEVEALILENNLIKRYRPKFNVMMKDSKTHPYLLVTLSEDFPRLQKVRKVKFNDGNRYFGPFPDERGLGRIIEMLSRSYRLCICKTPLISGKPGRRNCLRYQVGLCLGPCLDLVQKAAYRQQVDEVMSFLTGKKVPDLSTMQARMDALAEEFRFEEAAGLRDTMIALHEFFTAQKVEMISSVDRDFWGVAESLDVMVISLFFVRGGKLLGNKTMDLEGEPAASKEEVLGKMMVRFYENNLIPKKIFCHWRPAPIESICKYLSEKAGHAVRIGMPAKPEMKKLLRMADENAREILTNVKSKTSDRVSEGVLDLERRLQLPRLPVRIECVDISHLQGADPVASLVVAINGEARCSEYRRYHIKTVAGIDDPASIAEVTRRRFSRLLEEGGPLPDLFIVDGGIAQVRAAHAEMIALGVERPAWGLAKREETLVPPLGDPVKLPITSPAMRVLIKLRNEAHRFANTFQGKVHAKKMVRSALLNLPGVGAKTIYRIIQAFGSVQKAAQSSPEEIAGRANIPRKIAELVFNSIRE